ncbi:hypothetical protein ABIA32_006112 [Streptacidiphilus sp. MAP12-20]
MNPIRVGRLVLFLLPYVLVAAGVLVAGKVHGQAGGGHVAFEALVIAAVGVSWVSIRGWRTRRGSRR